MSPVVMTVLNKLRTTLKDKPLVTGLTAFVLLLVGLTLILVALTPKQGTALPVTPFMSTNFDQSTSDMRNINFTGSAPEVPNTLPIARLELNVAAAEQIAQKLMEQHQLQSIAQSKNIWRSSDASLFRDEAKAEYTFSRDKLLLQATRQPDEKHPPFNEPQLVALAQKTLDELLGANAYQPLYSGVTYLHIDGVHLDKTSKDEANFIEIPFSLKLSQYPVFVGHNERPPFILTFDSSGTLIKMTFQAQIMTTSILRQSPTITSQQAVSNITNGQGSVVSAYQQIAKPLDLKTIYSGTLTSAKIEYRADIESGVIFPVYRFSGILLNNQGTEITADVITPAVATNQLPNQN